MLAVTSLGSGSSGNALLVQTAGAVLLVDCGVGLRRLHRALAAVGLTIADIDAVLISHEHSDHIREFPRFIRTRHGSPQHARFGARGKCANASVGRNYARTHAPCGSADIEVVAIPVCHDAAEPCGFLIRSAAGSVTVVTDLGCASPPRLSKRLPSHSWSSWKRTMTRRCFAEVPIPTPAAPHSL